MDIEEIYETERLMAEEEAQKASEALEETLMGENADDIVSGHLESVEE